MTMTRDGKYESEREEPCRENRQAQRARNRAQEDLNKAGDELAHALQGRRAHGYSGAHTDVAQHHEVADLAGGDLLLARRAIRRDARQRRERNASVEVDHTLLDDFSEHDVVSANRERDPLRTRVDSGRLVGFVIPVVGVAAG